MRKLYIHTIRIWILPLKVSTLVLRLKASYSYCALSSFNRLPALSYSYCDVTPPFVCAVNLLRLSTGTAPPRAVRYRVILCGAACLYQVPRRVVPPAQDPAVRIAHPDCPVAVVIDVFYACPVICPAVIGFGADLLNDVPLAVPVHCVDRIRAVRPRQPAVERVVRVALRRAVASARVIAVRAHISHQVRHEVVEIARGVSLMCSKLFYLLLDTGYLFAIFS